MRHEDSHDPLTEWQRCGICHQGLSAAIAKLADMSLGPDQAERLIRVLREEANKAVAYGAAS